MPSLMELIEKVARGESIEPAMLAVYEDSTNSAEKFLAHHALAMIDLRRSREHLLQSLEAIDYADAKVLGQYVNIAGFLGEADAKAAPVVKYGSRAIARREWAVGMEAIASGLMTDMAEGGSYLSDQENASFAGMQYSRVAEEIGFAPATSPRWNNKTVRIGYITAAIADDDAAATAITGLVRHLDTGRFSMSVYSTEAHVRREPSNYELPSYELPSSRRGKLTLEKLKGQKISTWMAPTDTDVPEAARQLAERLILDQVDVVILDTNPADPIAALIAEWDVARGKMNLVRRWAMLSDAIDSICYVDAARYEADKAKWESAGTPARYVFAGIDIDASNGEAPKRSGYGIPEQAFVIATAGEDLDAVITPAFVDMMIDVLRAHPQAVWLMTGDGKLDWAKRKLEQSGVGKRVGYAGKRKDMPGFLRIADLYVASFPSADLNGLLGAMATERPMLVLSDGSPASAEAARIAGTEAVLNGSELDLVTERVSKLIREPAVRSKLGKSLRQRLEQHFSFSGTVRAIEQMVSDLMQASVGQDDTQVTMSDDEPAKKVA